MKQMTASFTKQHRLRRWLRRSYKIILICLAALLLLYAGTWASFYKLNLDTYNALPELVIPKSNVALLIAPHCDDEVLTNAILAKRLMDQGTTVHYVVVSNGDGFTPDIMLSSQKLLLNSSDYIRLGLLRQHETIQGLSLLGVPENHIRFLGYPDRGCREMLMYHWYKEAPYFDPWTQSSVVPYANSYGNRPELAGENMLRDISQVLREVQPDLILMPHPADQNVDHATVNVIAQLALGDLHMEDVPQILYLTHHALNTWPQQLYPQNAGPHLVPPREMQDVGDWHVLPLSAEDKDLKNTVIAQYRSQLVVDDMFLHSFVRNNELFADMGQPALVSGTHSDDEIMPNEANLLVSGGTVSALSKMVSGGQNIQGLYGEVSTEGNLHLMLQTRGRINAQDIHQIILLVGDGKDTTQSIITVQNGRAFETGMGFAVTGIKLSGDCIHLSIPYTEFEGIQSLMLSGCVAEFERIISETIWQSIRMPDAQEGA